MKHRTDWDEAGKWYDQIVGTEGHYYHRKVILPHLIKLLNLEANPVASLLDLGCGQGVLAKQIPSHVQYVGVDLAPSLIKAAKKEAKPNQSFHVADVCSELPLQKKDFTHAVMLLSLQNMEFQQKAIEHAAQHLAPKGLLAIVLNHPCFRIPRHSSWTIDQQQKKQSRKIDSYLSPLKIPIQTHPGSSQENTWSFHHSLSDYSHFLANAGFVLIVLDELASDKKSEGKFAKMEDRARKEFPLFLTILAQKV